MLNKWISLQLWKNKTIIFLPVIEEIVLVLFFFFFFLLYCKLYLEKKENTFKLLHGYGKKIDFTIF